MHFSSLFIAISALAASVSAHQKGFNYGSTNADGSCRNYADFHKQFTQAKGFRNAPGFTSARLYTNIQCGSTNSPIEAIKAAIDTKTNLLLGLWASSGQDFIDSEITALHQAIQQWGPQLKKRVVGISVGSEDLYRGSPDGIKNNAGPGATSDEIVSYINQLRAALKGTCLEGVPVGHVETGGPWTESVNVPVIDAVDFVGYNGFPYFDDTTDNSILKAPGLLFDDLGAVDAIANGKPVWVTETGWPTRGPTRGKAVPSPDNAKAYWNKVGCKMFGKRNVFWYTLHDADTAQTDMSFSVVDSMASNEQKFNLQCPK